MNTNNHSFGHAGLLLQDDFIDWDESIVISEDDDLLPDYEAPQIQGVYENQAEFIEVLLPLLGSALSAALPIVLPQVMQAGGDIVKGAIKTFTAPPKQQTAPATDNKALNALLQIINNPAVIQALAGGQGVKAANGTVITPAQITQTISQVAGSATPPPKASMTEEFPEFIFNNDDVPVIDPFDPVQKAELLNELLK